MQQILVSRLLSTRRGTAVLGILAALLAGVVLVAYLNSYRDSLKVTAAPVSVLVARNLIEKGTPGAVIAGKQLFQPTSLAEEDVKEGAISDPALVVDRVAQADIYPGQQLTIADFSAETTDAIPTRIEGSERAIAVAIDAAHGNLGQLRSGDHVDIYVSIKDTIRLLIPDVLVLSAPAGAPEGGAAAQGGANVVLRVKSADAPRVAFSADHGQLWLVLRPLTGASRTKPANTTVGNLNGKEKPKEEAAPAKTAAKPKPKPAATAPPPVSPAATTVPRALPPLPTAATISLNGKTETIAVGKRFPSADPTFKLLSLTRTSARMVVPGASGKRIVTVRRGGRITLVNNATGVRYVLRLKGLS
jgi:pilus assembly protein CpaB